MTNESVTRRTFVIAASTALGGAAAVTDNDKLTELSAVQAVRAMSQGQITAVQYAHALLDQCERAKALNAFITLDRKQVLTAAFEADQRRKTGDKLGPLHGLPMPIKDSVNTKDLRTTAGTPALRDFHPKADAPIVKILRDAGALVLGKTNLHELSFGYTSNNLAFGAVHNPYDPSRIPGGSSGGTAAAVAARMAPLGVAEDTVGSIRIPAALCGIAGFRPTTDRYPSSGVAPISPLFDQVGPHARSVEDMILFDSVAARDPKPVTAKTLKGLKLGIVEGYFWNDLDPEVERVALLSLKKLQEAGVELVEGEVEELPDVIARITRPIAWHDVLQSMPKYLKDSGSTVTFQQVLAQASNDVKTDFATLMPGGKDFVTEATYRAAVDTYLMRLRANYKSYFARTSVAAIVFPAARIPATQIGQAEVTIGGKTLPFRTAISRNIAPASTAGLPGLILPAGLTSAGLPVSLEFDGPAGSDREVLSLGLSLEQALGRLAAPPKM